MRHAKIVCTLGPATSSPERIRALVDAGMDVARLNLSHGTHVEHENVYLRVREAADATGRGVGVLVDLQGPKIRLGTFENNAINLKYGDRFTITTREIEGDETQCSTTYEALPEDVKPGDRILINDGRIVLEALDVTETEVHTKVVVGGPVSDHKGINLPGVAVSAPVLSQKDIDDLRWALRLRADMVALSFVRTPDDVAEVHKIMDEEGVRLPVIAKIEKPQAVAHLHEIARRFDGFMVARGDLGVELPLEEVPLVQKRIVDIARRNAKPVIVATQMLESMISSPQPTRAEASDVANAVLDGTDALMLSGETSVGAYPIDAANMMARIIQATEDHGYARIASIDWEPHTKSGIIAKAAAEVADRVNARYLIAFTQSGDTAHRVARLRPPTPILAFTPVQVVRSQLALSWGVETFLVDPVTHTDDMARQVDRVLLGPGRCQRGELVVIVAGSPPGIPGSTNALRVHRIGDAIDGIAPAYRSSLS